MSPVTWLESCKNSRTVAGKTNSISIVILEAGLKHLQDSSHVTRDKKRPSFPPRPIQLSYDQAQPAKLTSPEIKRGQGQTPLLRPRPSGPQNSLLPRADVASLRQPSLRTGNASCSGLEHFQYSGAKCTLNFPVQYEHSNKVALCRRRRTAK